MSVDDWARREADSARGPDIWTPAYDPTPERQAYFEGIVHAFSALLSDEAVEAAARSLHDGYAPLSGSFQPNSGWERQARTAIQAAVDAVTKETRND